MIPPTTQRHVVPVHPGVPIEYLVPCRGTPGDRLVLDLDVSRISFYTADNADEGRCGVEVAMIDDSGAIEILGEVAPAVLRRRVFRFEHVLDRAGVTLRVHVRPGTTGYRGHAVLDITAPGLVDRRDHIPPFALASSEVRDYAVEKLFDFRRPEGGGFLTQSSAPLDDGYLVLHDTGIQVYTCSGYDREITLRDGALLHPNDCDRRGASLWVCDTGEPEPELKHVELESWRVTRTLRPQLEGWRVAAISLADSETAWVAAVQAVPREQRDRILVAQLDLATGQVGIRFMVPTDQYYVQGCGVAGRFLYIGQNNGAVTLSKIAKVDLLSGRQVEVLTLDRFGETEGLWVSWDDGRLSLITALEQGLFRIRL